MLTPEEEASMKECEREIAELKKERDREIAELHAERRKIAREHSKKVEAEEKFSGTPKRYFDIFKEIDERRKAYAKRMERCTETIKKLRMKARGNESIRTTAEGAEVMVVHSVCMVYVRGLYSSQIKPHLDRIESHREIRILSKNPERYYRDNKGRSSWTLTLCGKDALNKYLEFNGWPRSPDS